MVKWLKVEFFLGVEDDRDLDATANDIAELVARNSGAPPWLTTPPYYIDTLTITEEDPVAR